MPDHSGSEPARPERSGRPMIEIRGVTRSYGAIKALDDAIVISGASARCFDILATVYTETNMHRLTRSDLGLKELR